MPGQQGIEQPPQPAHDVYIAAADPDLVKAERIANCLRNQDLDVVFDDGAQPQLLTELDDSRLLLAYYSRNFATEPRCNAALLRALAAGLRRGAPTAHMATLNPDDPHCEHIMPIEVADMKYIVPGSDDTVIIESITKKLRGITQAIGQTALYTPPHWIGKDILTSTQPTTEYYRKLWQIHNALYEQEYPLMTNYRPGGVVALYGPGHTEKTALAEAYANLLGAPYQGGIYWASLEGCEPTASAIRERLTNELRHLSESIGLAPDISPEHLAQDLSSHMRSQKTRSLWVFDNIPDLRSKDSIKELLSVSSSRYLHKIFITQQNILRDYIDSVPLLPSSPRY